MDEAASTKAFFLWDPAKQPRFVVASSSSKVVKIFEWDAASKQAREQSSKADLSDIRTLTWSPSSPSSTTSSSPAVLAAATSNAHISLISFPPPNPLEPLSRPTPTVSSTLPPRPRTTLALAFSPPLSSSSDAAVPQLLAQGLTKFGRSDACLWVWDVSRTEACSSSPIAPSQFDFASSSIPRPPSGGFTSTLDTPLAQLIQSDTVLALAWLDSSILAVSTVKSFIRLFDIRLPFSSAASSGNQHTTSPSFAPVLTFGTDYTQNKSSQSSSNSSSSKSNSASTPLRLIATGLYPSPHSPHLLASFDSGPPLVPHNSDFSRSSLRDGGSGSRKGSPAPMGEPSGGSVRVWDRRSPGREVFLATNDASTAGGARAGAVGGLRTGAVAIEWDPEREGRLAVLERGGDVVIFDLVDPFKEKEGEREGYGLVQVGEPIRILAPSQPSTINSFAFAYTNDDDREGSPPDASRRAQLATFSAAQNGRIDFVQVPTRHPLSFSHPSTPLYTSNLSVLHPILPSPTPPPSASNTNLSSSQALRRRPSTSQSPPASPPSPNSLPLPLHATASLPNIRPSTASQRAPIPPPLPIRQSMFENERPLRSSTARALSPLGREPWTAGDTAPSGSRTAAAVVGLRRGSGEKDTARASDGKRAIAGGKGTEQRGRSRSYSRGVAGDGKDSSAESKAARVLGKDIGAVMLERARMGYGLEDFERNAVVAEQAGEVSLAAVWRWFAQYSTNFSPSQARSQAYDFSFQGVHQIFEGFPPSSSLSSLSSLNPNYLSSTSLSAEGSRSQSGGATPTPGAGEVSTSSADPSLLGAPGAEGYLHRHLTAHQKSSRGGRSGSRSRHLHLAKGHHQAHQHPNQYQSASSQSRSSSAGPSGSSSIGLRPSVNRGHSPHHHSPQGHRSASASPSRTPSGSGGQQSSDFKSACAALNARRAVGSRRDVVRIAVSGGTKKVEERICCLGILGWDLDEEGLEREISRLEDEGRFEYAAFVALMTENGLRRAMQVLQNSETQNHLIVALFLSQNLERRKEQQRSSIDLSASQHIRKMDDPHLQAVWRYGLTGDWEDCLDEAEVPLGDRLAIALRFLPDADVRSLLNQHRRSSLKEGDISSLPLHGLSSPSTLLLFQSYLNATSDVQTVALLSAHVFPDASRYAKPRQWLAAYEDLLQRATMFEERAALREGRVGLAREWGVGGLESEPMSQVVLRCNYCNKNVNAPPTNDNPSQTGLSPSTLPAKLCPHCANNLPNCSICLMSISQPPDRTRDRAILEAQTAQDSIDWMPLFCLKCRHGGHRKHISEWFFGSSSIAPAHSPSHPLYDETRDKLARMRMRAAASRRDGEEADDAFRNSDEESSGEDEGNLTCAVAGCDCHCFD